MKLKNYAYIYKNNKGEIFVSSEYQLRRLFSNDVVSIHLSDGFDEFKISIKKVNMLDVISKLEQGETK